MHLSLPAAGGGSLGASLATEGITASRQYVSVVTEAIEQRGSELLVTEHRTQPRTFAASVCRPSPRSLLTRILLPFRECPSNRGKSNMYPGAKRGTGVLLV